MSWNLREQSFNNDGISTYDCLAPIKGTYNVTIKWPSSCNVINTYALIAFKAASGKRPAFVQGASTSGPLVGGGFTTYTIAFPSPNISGNQLVIDVGIQAGGAIGWTCSDSNGNSYALVMGEHTVGSAGTLLASFICLNAAAGANTVTLTANTPNTFLSATVAIHEYSGIQQVIPLAYPVWAPNTVFSNSELVIQNTNFSIVWQVSGLGGGTSGAVTPNWPTPNSPPDGSVTWGSSGVYPPTTFGGFIADNNGCVDTADYNSGAGLNSFTSSVTTTQNNDLLHLVTTMFGWCAYPTSISGGDPLQSPFLTPSWLLVNEPTLGITDRSTFLFLGEGTQHSFNLQLRQRGNATYTLVSNPQDSTSAPSSYLPTQFQPIYLFDQNASGWTLVFAGILQTFKERWVGTDGLRYIDCTAVSLESIFDTIYAQPVQYVNQTCGFIVADLFTRFELGSPVSLGTISAGVTIPLFNANLGDKLSDLFTQLATTSGFVWGVDPSTQELYFYLPNTTPAPFDLTSTEALWDTISEQFDGADYRNRQAVKLSFDAFEHSKEFFVGAGQTTITLARAVTQVTNAWATLSTCNTATGSFAGGQPSPGDTATIGPANGAWQAAHIYALGGVIVVNGFVQKVTTAGTSGGSQPAFSTVTGATTVDNTMIWTCEGPSGLATGTQTYTFVTVIDNTQFGEVLIGSSAAVTCQNFADALNATVSRAGVQLRGVTFSLPTWENGQCNAINVSGTNFTLQQKSAGSGWVAQMSTTSATFAWSATQTSGGTSPQGSLGPNEGATIELSVYAQGTSTAAPGLAYTEGSNIVTLATPLNAGSNLNVEYTRVDGNVIEVENTPLVTALALITHGTGKNQRISDQSSTGLISTSAAAGLQFAQEALAAYDVIPTELEVMLYQPGLLPGQVWTWLLSGVLASLNADYFVEEVRAELVPTDPWLDSPASLNAGHYKYTIKVIDISQIGSYLDFWLGLGGGSSGGGQGGALVATSGGAQSTTGTLPLIGGVNTQTTNYTAVAGDSGKLLTFKSATAVTLTLPSPPPFAQWCIWIECTGAGTLTVNRNGLTIDGNAANLQFFRNDGCYLTTDGANYFTERGEQLRGLNSQTGNFTAADVNNGQLITFNSATPVTLTLPPAPTAGWSVWVENIGAGALTVNPNGLLMDGSASSLALLTNQGIAIGSNSLIYSTMRGAPPLATSTTPGIVQPDGTIITVSGSGGITVPKATASAFGVVEVDNVTITAAGGVISATSSAGGMAQLAQQVLGSPAATVTFSSIPAGYSSLMIVITTASSTAAVNDTVYLQANGDTAAHYGGTFLRYGGSSSSVSSQNLVAKPLVGEIGTSGDSPEPGNTVEILIPGYALTTFDKSAVARSSGQLGNAGFNMFGGQFSWYWQDTAGGHPNAITSLTLGLTGAGNFITGSVFTLYGLK